MAIIFTASPELPPDLPETNDLGARYLEVWDSETGVLLQVYRYDPKNLLTSGQQNLGAG